MFHLYSVYSVYITYRTSIHHSLSHVCREKVVPSLFFSRFRYHHHLRRAERTIEEREWEQAGCVGVDARREFDLI